MRLTLSTKRLAQAATLAALAALVGCQKLPYIDQSKEVPHENLGTIATEDKEIQQAQFLSSSETPPLPRLSKPRTTNDPEAREIWQLTLEKAIQIGLDNSEVVRVISLGAQGIPIGGFEPSPLSNGAGGALGQGSLSTIYDPAIQETQIAQALSNFDTNFTTSMLWGHSINPLNNGNQAGVFTGTRYPIIFNQDTAQFSAGVQKRTATGAQIGVTHNIQYLFSNSPNNLTPSAYTTNLQLALTQPLLGSAPLANNQGPGTPVGLEANRAPIIVARITADSAVWRFKSEVMAEVRSIEQQYWTLAQQHVQLWSSEKAVELAEEILKREQSELEVGRGTFADVAEAEQRLEQFRLDLVTRTSDVITTERQLRNLLGLPPADDRRIVPVTAPTEARLEPDWDASLAQMLTFQPDIIQQQLQVRIAELQLLVARNQLLPQLSMTALYQLNGLGHGLDGAEAVMTGKPILGVDPRTRTEQAAAGLNALPGKYSTFPSWQFGLTYAMPLGMRAPLANVRGTQYGLLRQRAYLQQTVHQTTHALARFFIEVDANYKQFKTASRYRAAAAQRLESGRAFYEEGKITIDRYLDAVSQYASAVALEAQYKTSYNISIIALEEAKGTLLAYDNIAVAEGPHPQKAYIQAKDQQAAHRVFPLPHDGDYHPNVGNGSVVPDPMPSQPASDIGAPKEIPAFPSPIGPLGPPPTFSPPFAPVGEPNQSYSSNDPTEKKGDGGVIPVGGNNPALPLTGNESLPALPEDVNLPPLPK